MFDLFGSERLAEIERERVAVMHELEEVARQQKALGAQMRQLERELRAELRHVEEHWVSEDRELGLEDVEAWLSTTYFNLAHTMLGNPHVYCAKKKVKLPRMYERVVAYILEHGYKQRYKGAAYTTLDVQLWSCEWFCWLMSYTVEQSQIINAKPASMKPKQNDA